MHCISVKLGQILFRYNQTRIVQSAYRIKFNIYNTYIYLRLVDFGLHFISEIYSL